MTTLRVMVLCFSYFTDNSINPDWVQLLLSHNGYPVDSALVGAGSLSPITFAHLLLSSLWMGWRGDLNSKLDNQIESLVHCSDSLSFWYTHPK
jgi:hypothetical protein